MSIRTHNRRITENQPMHSAVFRLALCAIILAAIPAISRAEQGLIAHYTFDEGTGNGCAGFVGEWERWDT